MLKKQTLLLLFLLVHIGLWAKKRYCPEQVFICSKAKSSAGLGYDDNPTNGYGSQRLISVTQPYPIQH